MNKNDVAGLILAGGKSLRMQKILQDESHTDIEKPRKSKPRRHKFFLPLANKSLLEHCIDRLKEHVSDVAVSTNDFSLVKQNLPTEITNTISFCKDGAFLECGPLAGIYSGLKMYNDQEQTYSHIISLPADSPFISHDVFSKMLITAKLHPKVIISCSSQDNIHYACSIWPTHLKNKMKIYLDSGKRSIKGFIQENNTKTIHFENDESSFFNINTPEDYIYAKKLFGKT